MKKLAYIPQTVAITNTSMSPSKRTMLSPREVASPKKKGRTKINSPEKLLLSLDGCYWGLG